MERVNRRRIENVSGRRLILLAVGLIGIFAGLNAASFSGQTEGRFINSSGPEGVVASGLGTSVFSWGDIRSSSLVPNQFRFLADEFTAEEGEPFVIGMFEYSNGETELGTNANAVDLEIVVTLADSLPRSFVFPLVIGTTVNSENMDQSSDALSIAESTSDQVILTQGERFVLHVEFGRTSEDGFGLVDRFNVFENAVARAELVGTITRIKSLDGLSVGVFDEAQGGAGMVTIGEGSDTFTWGTASGGNRPNQFRFEGLEFGANTELPFTVGRMHYYNGSISPESTADQVSLIVVLDLPNQLQETFEFPLNIITTTNSSNRENSADIVEIGASFAERSIMIDGVEFGLKLMFGNTTEEGFSEFDRFFVFEDSAATADLQAVLTQILPQIEPEINLEIATAVEIKFRTFPDTSYQIQSSMNLTDWENEGDAIEGSGRLFQRFFSVPRDQTRVFRVVTASMP